MPRKTTPEPPPRPTDAELAILRVLWEQGSGTVREILDGVNAARPEPLAYTTVSSFLQIMTEKRLVVRTEGARGHLYEAALPAEGTKRQMVSDLMDRVFGGSAHALVLQALGAGKVSAVEVRAIRKLLAELEP